MKMNKTISLKNLVDRIELAERLKSENPERKDMLEKEIIKQKEYIIQCVLENSSNPLLDRITMN